MNKVYFSCAEISKILQLQLQLRKEAFKFICWIRKTYPEHKLVVAETYRSASRQDELYKRGKNVTMLKGGQSKHQQGKAMDLYFVANGKILPVDKAPYRAAGKEWAKRGGIWGGNWRVPAGDFGHYEFL